MIHYILIQNKAGVTRLGKYYVPTTDQEKRRTEYELHRLLKSRRPQYFTNFVEAETTKIVYKQYAGLFVIICCDSNNNEYSMLEAIHLFVELLDSYFSHVCEMDIIFNFHKAYMILDEFILGGEIVETSKKTILDRLDELDAIKM